MQFKSILTHFYVAVLTIVTLLKYTVAHNISLFFNDLLLEPKVTLCVYLLPTYSFELG